MFDSMGQPKVLDAVNYILRNYGSSEVSRLNETKEAVAAEKSLNDELVKLLMTGYNFCTVNNVTLHRDADDYINLPADCLDFKPTPSYRTYKPVKRGNRAYSLALNTFEFPVDLKGDLIKFWPFEELPVQAAAVVCIRAAIARVAAKKPDDPSLRGLDADLREAVVKLENYDHTVSEYRVPHFDNWRL